LVDDFGCTVDYQVIGGNRRECILTAYDAGTGSDEENLRPAPRSFAKPDFPLNAWYAAAWDVEVTRALFARTICGQQLVLYRTEAGRVVALQDACWHRLYPLSRGRLASDRVVCGYHGLQFDTEGRCVFMPAQDTVNPSAAVRSYPVAERHRLIWVWPGDPAQADLDRIPDLHWTEDPRWTADGRLIHARCNYKLVLDNLMDLTHETYVHATSIGNEHVTAAPFDVEHGDDMVRVTRWMLDGEAPPTWAEKLGKPGNVDRWQIIDFQAPSTIVIDVGVAPAGSGAPKGDRSVGVRNMVLNTLTPEWDNTCHYFWGVARDYNLTDQALTHRDREGVTAVFGEDEAVLAAQQRAIEANPDRLFYNLNIDLGAMWVRRVIDGLIAAEAADKPARAGREGP
jgi:phenylpropionate dioxygenase-like ring-hydroxylating dioxygenase large terminal subunit